MNNVSLYRFFAKIVKRSGLPDRYQHRLATLSKCKHCQRHMCTISHSMSIRNLGGLVNHMKSCTMQRKFPTIQYLYSYSKHWVMMQWKVYILTSITKVLMVTPSIVNLGKIFQCACSGKPIPIQQRHAEPPRCLALRARTGRLKSSFVSWKLSLYYTHATKWLVDMYIWAAFSTGL